MTTEELESKLQGGTETQTLDIKAACDWNADTMAKDILAMTNVRDGGYIIIGVEDGTFARQGINAMQRATYAIETMRDQLRAFADPHVTFTVEFPRDSTGLEYAVLRVMPFEEIPVICATDRAGLRRGVVYYRNSNARVESAAVSNSYDMHDIILTATVKMMRRLRASGFTVDDQPDEAAETRRRLEEERENL
ncbi:MAG: ATP-binding protein [Minisyncoccia bacterium]|jgi:predicted HTH transcriptional regulator